MRVPLIACLLLAVLMGAGGFGAGWAAGQRGEEASREAAPEAPPLAEAEIALLRETVSTQEQLIELQQTRIIELQQQLQEVELLLKPEGRGEVTPL